MSDPDSFPTLKQEARPVHLGTPASRTFPACTTGPDRLPRDPMKAEFSSELHFAGPERTLSLPFIPQPVLMRSDGCLPHCLSHPLRMFPGASTSHTVMPKPGLIIPSVLWPDRAWLHTPRPVSRNNGVKYPFSVPGSNSVF